MKKPLILTIAFLFVVLPFTSFTKTPVTDGELDEVTAEVGVSLDFNNLKVGGIASLGVTSWGDSDGYSGSLYTAAGFAGPANVFVGGDIAVFSGISNIDVGTSGTRTGVTVAPVNITLGTMNVDTILKIGTTMDLSTSKPMAELRLTGLSTQLSAARVQLFAH
jgi:hypothetical protein